MWNNAVVANAGIGILINWIKGGMLTITRAKLGSGTVNADILPSATNVTGYIQDASIVQSKRKDSGMQYTVRIKPGNDAFTVKQIGIFGKLDSGNETLIAIYQDGTGISVPSKTDMPEFIYDFNAVVAMGVGSNLTVNIDSTLYAKLSDIPTDVSAFDNDAGYLVKDAMLKYGYAISENAPALPVGGVWLKPTDRGIADPTTSKAVCGGGTDNSMNVSAPSNGFTESRNAVLGYTDGTSNSWVYVGFNADGIQNASSVTFSITMYKGGYGGGSGSSTYSAFAVGDLPQTYAAAEAGAVIGSGTLGSNNSATMIFTMTGTVLSRLKNACKNGRVYIALVTRAAGNYYYDASSVNLGEAELNIIPDDPWKYCDVLYREK